MTKNCKATHTPNLKALRRLRTELCNDRSVWQLKEPNALHIDYCLDCDHTKFEPGCEGCVSKGIRAGHLAEIAAGIKAIDDQITAITGKPYGTAKPKQAKPNSKSTDRAEQLPLFG